MEITWVVIAALVGVIVMLIILLCLLGCRSRNSTKVEDNQMSRRRKKDHGSFQFVNESRRRLSSRVSMSVRRNRGRVKGSDPAYCRREVTIMDLLRSHGYTEYWKGAFNTSSSESQPFTVRGLKESTKIKDVIEFQRLASTLCTLSKHANVIETLGADTTKLPYYIYHESMEGVSLYDKLKENDENHYLRPLNSPNVESSFKSENASCELEVLLKISRDVIRGLSFLSSHKLFHPGINAKEVLITANTVCKLYNFQTKTTARRYMFALITEENRRLPWHAPETVHNNKYSSASDVWSLGVLLYEIFSCARVSYESLTLAELQSCYDNVCNHLLRPSECPRKIYDIMTSCWHLDRNDRLSMDQVLNKIEKELQPFDKVEERKSAALHRYANLGVRNVQQH